MQTLKKSQLQAMSMPSYVKQDYSEHGGFESLFFMNLGMDEKTLLQAVQEVFPIRHAERSFG